MSPKVLEELDLAQGALGENLLAEDIGDLLNGDALVCLVVYSSTVPVSIESAISLVYRTFLDRLILELDKRNALARQVGGFVRHGQGHAKVQRTRRASRPP